MRVTRRQFLKLTGAAAGGLLLPAGFALADVPRFPLHKAIGEKHSICPYCSVGCGLLIANDLEGHISNCEGDPDHIVNRGGLDPKSVSVPQLSTKPLAAQAAPVPGPWERPVGSQVVGLGRPGDRQAHPGYPGRDLRS
jgi:hypothetical protein